jgi:hypothetical protein
MLSHLLVKDEFYDEVVPSQSICGHLRHTQINSISPVQTPQFPVTRYEKKCQQVQGSDAFSVTISTVPENKTVTFTSGYASFKVTYCCYHNSITKAWVSDTLDQQKKNQDSYRNSTISGKHRLISQHIGVGPMYYVVHIKNIVLV